MAMSSRARSLVMRMPFSSCLLLAAGGSRISTARARTATTGRPSSALGTPATPATSSSARATATPVATSTVALVSRCVRFALLQNS